MKTFQLEVVTPDSTALSARATALQAPSWEGYLGVLAGHAPLLCVLRAGVLTVRPESGAAQLYAIKGGFMEVTPQRVIVLADAIEPASAIDAAAATKALEVAQAPLTPAEGQSAAAKAEATTARSEAIDWAK